MALVAVMRQDRERVEPPANALASGCLGPRPAASSTDGEASEREAQDIEAAARPVPGSRRSERRDGVPKGGQENLGPEHATKHRSRGSRHMSRRIDLSRCEGPQPPKSTFL